MAEKRERNTNVKRGKSKKIWIIIVAAALVIIGYFAVSNALSPASAPKQARITELKKGELRKSIGVKGNVQSVSKRNIYSNLGLTVKSVDVSVGDTVKAGQALCRLDTAELELNIKQQRLEIDATNRSGENQIESNEEQYNDAASNIANGKNAQIQGAEAALRSAGAGLDGARSAYENAKADYDSGKSQGRAAAENAASAARADLDQKERDYKANKELAEAGAVANDVYVNAQTAYINAQSRLAEAQAGVEAAQTAERRALDLAKNALTAAQAAYSNAAGSLDTARNAAKQELSRLEKNMVNSISANNSESKEITIQKLERQLGESAVASPIDGVVTAVYAKEGGASQGILFVVEDTSGLSVKTKLKEIDIDKVQIKMPVKIKSDALGDTEYDGTVSKIEPAAIKNAQGETENAQDVEYAAEVSVDSKDTKLRIGMNSRLEVILDKREAVFYVPFDALVTTKDRGSFVYAAVDAGEKQARAMEIPVETGMETDFYIEVRGDNLAEGLYIVNDAADLAIYDGMPVTVKKKI